MGRRAQTAGAIPRFRSRTNADGTKRCHDRQKRSRLTGTTVLAGKTRTYTKREFHHSVTRDTAHRTEDIATVTGQCVELSQDLNGLGRERNQMLSRGLRHKVPPLTLVKIELSPLGLAQLSGSSEQHRCELERAEDGKRAGKAIERPKHGADLRRLRDRSKMRRLRRWNGIDQITSRIKLTIAFLDSVAECATDLAANLVGCETSTATVDPLEDREDFGRIDFRYRPLAYERRTGIVGARKPSHDRALRSETRCCRQPDQMTSQVNS